MKHAHRPGTHHPFSAAVEVLNTTTSQRQHVLSGELNRFGCFLITTSPFPLGTRVWLQIEHAGAHFAAFGKVAYVLPEGMGVVFSAVEKKDALILDFWLTRKIE